MSRCTHRKSFLVNVWIEGWVGLSAEIWAMYRFRKQDENLDTPYVTFTPWQIEAKIL